MGYTTAPWDRTVSGSSGWFFGENGSIDGGMIQAFSAGIHAGT